MTGAGELSHDAVYGFGNYSNLGCWKDKPGRRRTMTRLTNFRGRYFIDWNDLRKMGLHLVELSVNYDCTVKIALQVSIPTSLF